MKGKNMILAGGLLALVPVGFWVGIAYTATGCFTDTNGHWAEQAICWMKQNRLVVGTLFKPNDMTTRAQSAVWLQKVSQIPPSQGLILISEGFGNWRPFFSSDNLIFENYSNVSYVKKATTGGSFISLQPSIPTVLYGRSLQFLGVEFCYTASASAVFSYIEINTYTHTNSAGPRTLQFSDGTDRSDSACLYYKLPAPVTLTAEDGVNVFVQGAWNTASSPLIIGRTTFVFKPTGTLAAAPSMMNEVLLEERGASDSSPTSAP